MFFSAYKVANCFQGEAGAKGARGLKGIKGAVGDAGIPGQPGSVGSPGRRVCLIAFANECPLIIWSI